MINRLLTSLCLAGCILGTANLPILFPTKSPVTPGLAQAQTVNDLYYTFYGQRVPLTLRRDAIAVQFKPNTSRTRGNLQPLHLQLQQALMQSGSTSRGINTTPVQVEVNPLGERYALVTLPPGSSGTDPSLTQRIEQQTYVENTLPVLSRSLKTNEQSTAPQNTIVLPNEIILSLESKLSNSQMQQLLDRHDLDLIRPLRFTQNRYLVRSRSATGVSVLDIANQLSQTTGIQSATPNFVQALPYTVTQARLSMPVSDRPSPVTPLQPQLTSLASVAESLRTTLLPLAWHLDSTAQRKRLPRTDVRAVDAWKTSQKGKGTVVAVIDSLIQWDHPDLTSNIYTVPQGVEKLPGEVHGWDFATNDADTRISDRELGILSPHFRNTFTLSDADLLQRYSNLAAAIKQRRPDLSSNALATVVRDYIRHSISAEFHGTWTTGVIAARPNTQNGAIGAAPNAQVLPVRVFGLGGEIQSAALIEAVGYASARKVDVINMSLGGLLPDQELTSQIFDILDAHPKLVIIASAGNESLDGVAFPAAIPGVLSVGATNLTGNRAFYSSFGGRLDVVAPGGETTTSKSLGILTTGGTFTDHFWQGVPAPNQAWGLAFDPQGKYVQVEGTSFSAPTVAGVLALMKGEGGKRTLTRTQLLTILKKTASYRGLSVSKSDLNRYRLQAAIGFGTAGDFPFLRPSGVFTAAHPVSPDQYFFGKGLVNAEAAVKAVQRSR